MSTFTALHHHPPGMEESVVDPGRKMERGGPTLNTTTGKETAMGWPRLHRLDPDTWTRLGPPNTAHQERDGTSMIWDGWMDGGNGPPAWVDGAQDLSPEPFWETKVLESEKNGLWCVEGLAISNTSKKRCFGKDPVKFQSAQCSEDTSCCTVQSLPQEAVEDQPKPHAASRFKCIQVNRPISCF